MSSDLTHTADPRDLGLFTDANLSRFDGVVFALNSDSTDTPPVSRGFPEAAALTQCSGHPANQH